ncbi:isochorismatase family protein [Ruicaihuangia caeni]|uniref:nicotinamidase n=1 Tax=Ruicaihuangia caeni TaxID=3042517 RepID=A0AAW6TCI6_9MICO|nr:isochorismatase family protein [Klugiella sp. YN-L-19]MDI2099297.1 isochorismatase family protein [Klugiella sp. YN-L-19]
MTKALFIIDVQNDFTEGGALGVTGGAEVARRITELLAASDYDVVFASRDWHDADNDNGGHFSETPDYVDTWPPHCVAGTPGAEYHPALDVEAIDVHIRKGQGKPDYSIFQGRTDAGASLREALDEHRVTEIDVVGIATDHCVRASALDALAAGRKVRVLERYTAGVDEEASAEALAEVRSAGGQVAYDARAEG